MNYEIIPNEGVGNLRFGMTPDEVRTVAGNNYEPFFGRGSPEKFPAYNYMHLGMFCYFDDTGILDAIEFYDVGRPMLDGIDLMVMTLAAAQELFRSQGGRIGHDDATLYELGVGIWSSHADYEPIESVIVFRPGYYDGIEFDEDIPPSQ